MCMNNNIKYSIVSAVAALGLVASVAMAADITPKMQLKIDTYKKQSATWAADPAIVKAVKDANAQGPISGMGNAKWRELKEDDPIVSGLVSNASGQLLTADTQPGCAVCTHWVAAGLPDSKLAFRTWF